MKIFDNSKKITFIAISVLSILPLASCSSKSNLSETTTATTTATVITTMAKIEEPTSDDEPSKWADYISDSYVKIIDYKQTPSKADGKFNISIRAEADLATNPDLTVKNLYKQSKLILKQFKKCNTIDVLSISFVDEQDNYKVYMSYDIPKKELTKNNFNSEKWDTSKIPYITENFIIDDSLSECITTDNNQVSALSPNSAENSSEKPSALIKSAAENNNISIDDISEMVATDDGKYMIMVYVNTSSQLTNKLAVRSMHNDISELIKPLQNCNKLDTITFFMQGDFIDSYGNKTKDTAMRVNFNASTIDKINFTSGYWDSDNIPNIADGYWVHKSLKD